jgi:serine protease Do
MDSKDNNKRDLMDEDISKEIDDEELQVLVLEAQHEALIKAAKERNNPKIKRPFPKWLFWLISIVLFFNTFGMIFQIYSIPAIDFLITSSKLSQLDTITEYKKSVVVIKTEDSKGTGFSISNDGVILTNYHVVEGNDSVTVLFPNEGRFSAEVIHTYPSVDLAVVKVKGDDFPFLQLAEKTEFEDDEPVYFIGNPLSFTGIANQGKIIDYLKLPDWDVPVVMMKAPVYRGNSGSPVINRNGKVIGIVFATSNDDTYGNVGLFVPIDEYFRQQK